MTCFLETLHLWQVHHGNCLLYTSFKSLIKEEKGQGMVEYALIIALIAIVVMAALSPLGEKIKAVFEKITNKLSS